MDQVPRLLVVDRWNGELGGASVAVFCKEGGHFGEILEGVVEAGGQVSCQSRVEVAALRLEENELRQY